LSAASDIENPSDVGRRLVVPTQPNGAMEFFQLLAVVAERQLAVAYCLPFLGECLLHAALARLRFAVGWSHVRPAVEAIGMFLLKAVVKRELEDQHHGDVRSDWIPDPTGGTDKQSIA